jgi:hypothetical protein
MKLDEKIPCQVCGKKTDRIATHEGCLIHAIYLTTLDSPDADFNSPTVRHIADDCYLCGEPLAKLPTHADHVRPISAGGSNHWSNIGATHAACNLSKQADVGITSEQQSRLDAQHAKLREVADRIDDGIWYQELANHAQLDRPYWIDDAELLHDYLEDWFEDGVLSSHSGVVDGYLEMVENPDLWRGTVSKQRLGIILDQWRAEDEVLDAEWEVRHQGMTSEEIHEEAMEDIRRMFPSDESPPVKLKASSRSKLFNLFGR